MYRAGENGGVKGEEGNPFKARRVVATLERSLDGHWAFS